MKHESDYFSSNSSPVSSSELSVVVPLVAAPSAEVTLRSLQWSRGSALILKLQEGVSPGEM